VKKLRLRRQILSDEYTLYLESARHGGNSTGTQIAVLRTTRMFELSLVDHLRLTFAHVMHRHRTHARLAQSYAKWSRWLRAAEAVLMMGVGATAIAAVSSGGRFPYVVASAALAAVALLTLLIHLTFNFDGTSAIHAVCAARLWHIRERYQALLSDLTDGAIDVETARARRDALMTDLHAIYEHGGASEHHAYQEAGRAFTELGQTPVSDEEIDRFLPKALQRHAAKSTPA
jgi:hypothetical protein